MSEIVDGAQPVVMTDDMLINTGNGRPITWAEHQGQHQEKLADARFRNLVHVMRARREEVDRLAGHIEQAMYEARDQDTREALLSLAGKVLKI